MVDWIFHCSSWWQIKKSKKSRHFKKIVRKLRSQYFVEKTLDKIFSCWSTNLRNILHDIQNYFLKGKKLRLFWNWISNAIQIKLWYNSRLQMKNYEWNFNTPLDFLFVFINFWAFWMWWDATAKINYGLQQAL